MSRRVRVGLGALLALVSVGCSRGEQTPGSASEESAPIAHAGETPFQASTTPRGAELLERARATFARALPELRLPLAAHVASFTTDGRSIGAVPESRFDVEPARVRLPKLADGALAVEAGAMRLEVRPLAFAASPAEWSEHVAVYPDVQSGVHAFRVVAGAGVEDLYQVDEPRAELAFAYDVAHTNVAGLRVVGASVEFLDASGTPRLRAPQPIVFDADGAPRVGRMTVTGCAYDTAPIGPWGRPVVAPGASTCRIEARVDGRGLRYPVLVDPAWETTFKTTKQTHAYHKLLRITGGKDSGKAILVGGTGTVPALTELYDPVTKTWSDGGSFAAAVTFGIGMNAAAFANGTLLVCGGLVASTTSGTAQQNCQWRDPATGEWQHAAAMSVGRMWHSMEVVTIGGKELALVVGGMPSSSLSSSNKPHDTTTLWDPTDDSWSTVASKLTTGRAKARSAVLGDGRVLLVGGEGYTTFTQYLESAEIFTPSTAAWAATANMAAKRSQPELVALAGSAPRAIVAGGATSGSASSSVDSIEYFDGTTWTTLAAKLAVRRWQFASARLDDGRVLFTGGQSYDSSTFTTIVTNTAEVFVPGSDPTTGTMAGAGTLSIERQLHAMVNLPGFGALVAGGHTSSSTHTTAADFYNTTIGGACGAGGACPAGLSCVDGVCCTAASCGVGETCAAPGREGVCAKPKGASCASNAECATGYCVTGVCCDNACTGGCRSCNEAGREGTCTFAAAGTDPGGFCTGSSDPTCGRKCNGAGACGSYATEGTACGASVTDAGTTLFCETWTCSSFGSCGKTTNNCGLTCTTSVTCDEPTKTCTPLVSGIKAGYCVIDGVCWGYGDINPDDSCEVCDPPVSKTSWSLAVSCMDGGVDTGVEEDTGASEDTGSPTDTGTPDTSKPDTGTATDTGAGDTGAPDGDLEPASNALPEAQTCGCRTPGSSGSTPLAAVAGLALTLVVAARRRRG